LRKKGVSFETQCNFYVPLVSPTLYGSREL